MTTLVYAYGCDRPVAGSDALHAEHARCVEFWNALVAVDDRARAAELAAAEADDPAIAAASAGIMERVAARAALAADAAGEAKRLSGEIATLAAERRRLMAVWRKANRPKLKEIDRQRLDAVKAARQATPCWWGNYLRILRSYDTGRQVMRRTGGRLRPQDPADTSSGLMALDIQRTPSGLGAAPAELFDGTVAALQIGSASMPGRRSRMMEMRVDRDGNLVRLPVCLHRPLPDGSRIKRAELKWSSRAGRTRWRLCLTVSLPAAPQAAPLSREALLSPARLAIDWRHDPDAPGPIARLTIGDDVREWSLADGWWRRAAAMAQQAEEFHATLRDGAMLWESHHVFGPHLAGLRAGTRTVPTHLLALQAHWSAMPEDIRDWYREARRLWAALAGLESRLLGWRREQYRLIAREIVRAAPVILLPEDDLASVAMQERRSADNGRRHLLAPHTLRLEVIHQARKAGCRALASAAEEQTADDEKSTVWARRKTRNQERSQTAKIAEQYQ